MDNPSDQNPFDLIFKKVCVEELNTIIEPVVPKMIETVDRLVSNSVFLGLDRPDVMATAMQALNFVFSTTNIGVSVGCHAMFFDPNKKELNSPEGLGDPDSVYSKIRMMNNMLMSYLCLMNITNNLERSEIEKESLQRSMDSIMDGVREILQTIE